MILSRFVEMLRQMALYFNVGQIQRVIYCWQNATTAGFMLVMDNGEYWYVTNVNNPERWIVGDLAATVPGVPTPTNQYELFKYLPPLPALSDVGPMTAATFEITYAPDALNQYVEQHGGGDSHYMMLDQDS